MSNNHIYPPAPDELEISIFGSGYGEAIVLHMGNGQWAVIDSCPERESGRPVALVYLENLGLDVTDAVTLIVATHWHDDHIGGISTICRECKSAKFVIPGAIKSRELEGLIELYGGSALATRSGLDEFVEVFRILDERKEKGTQIKSPTFAIANSVLHNDELSLSGTTIKRRISSLSPSDSCILRANFDLLWPKEGEHITKITPPTPNQTSVVLWVEIGSQSILLGADLEKPGDPSIGWTVILNNSTVISGLAAIFKVPHHGAESAHEPRVWSEMLHPNPIALITPFSLGDKFLPTTEDIQRLNGLTSDAYITSQPSKRKRHKWRNRVVRELVEGATRGVYDVLYGWGHIRVRRRIVDQSASYETVLLGDAIPLKSMTSSN